jgi:hypothetical protein
MTTTYTWVIDSLDCIPSAEGQSNVVSNVHWRVNAKNDTHEATVYGTQSLTYIAKSLFTPYDKLTKDQVISWAQEAMGIDNVTRLQEALDKQLEALANPPVVTPPLPWTE